MPPARPRRRAAVKARTRTSCTTRNVPSCAGKPSTGSARTSPGAASGFDDGNAETNARIRQGLQSWWGDPDLAGVHAKDALARLPDEEREQWERLWSDVDALLRRVSVPEQ